MARRRKYGEDLTYAEWHRKQLPEFYKERGHRLAMADRDWTEWCYYCREPLALAEEVVDRGQDLTDKNTRTLEKLAERAHIRALLIAPRFNRPAHIQNRINELQAEIRSLESAYPIQAFRLRRLWPNKGPVIEMAPAEVALELLIIHRDHHSTCYRADRSDPVYKTTALRAAKEESRLWTPIQQPLTMRGLTP